MRNLPTFLTLLSASLLSVSALTLTNDAKAASLEQVNGWDNSGLPGDVAMYAYVPDEVLENPPLLVLIHYCGGTAPAVFGQAQGGGVVAAADEHGFIIIAPSSGRCWDIVSDTTRTREGGGDSHAIRTMVDYALETYGANADRVYVTGNSSGGMMTELLLGLYPDVFKGGSAMAGMPAGCRGENESGDGGGYSGACAGGNVDLTPDEWGAIVDSLSPGFTGLRPRVQLFHGDDDDLIRIKNHTEAIEQWSDVLGLPLAPTEETAGITLGTHQGIRQTWEAECGHAVLEAFTSLGGDHGPSDALFMAEYLIPFLGLDQTGPIDPYVQACGTPDDGGTGGQSGTGGVDGVGGAEGSGGGGSGGVTGAGGAPANGGAEPGASGGASAGSGGVPIAPGAGGSPGSSDGAGDSSASSDSSEGGGCSVGGPPQSPFFLFFALSAACASLLVRRRGIT